MGLLFDRPPRRSTAALPLDELLRLLQRADLRGRGGAAFPTATKISSARGRRPVIIVNACDGEPLVAKDEVLLRLSPGLVADGAALVAHALGARRVVFAAHTGSSAERMAYALLDREASRLPNPGVLSVPRRYVSSESTALASLLAGGEARPRFTEQPLTLGRESVLVLNAETVAQIALLAAGHPGPLTRLVTVTGAVAAPGVLEILDSAPLASLVERAGGFTEPPRAVLIGGYSGTWLPWSTAAPMSVESLSQQGIQPGAGLVHLLGSACPVNAVAEILGYLAAESAGQCGPCMFGLPALAQDWSELGDPRTAAAALARLTRRLPVVEGRGACHHPDGVVRQAASALHTFADHLGAHRIGACDQHQPLLAGAR